MANTSDRAAATLEPAVAVEQLGPEDTQRIFAHFMALSSDDRARRFSYQHANSEWTMRYTRQIDFARQSLLALTTSISSIVALLQICRFRDNGDPRAELAFSVRPDRRDAASRITSRTLPLPMRAPAACVCLPRA